MKNNSLAAKSFLSSALTVGFCGLSLFVSGCGGIKPGKPAPATDAAPSGNVEAIGTLVGQNAVTVSGSVSVYNSPASNTHVLRIDNLAIPANPGNQIFLEVSGQVVFTVVLKSASGNQNYDTGLATSQIWTQATIRTSSNVNNPAIAIAVLTQP